jgi:uncharacterized protein Usg
MMKQKFLLLFLLGGLILVWGCGQNPPGPTNGKTFTIEYDHQVSYDCFVWGRTDVENAFKVANTVLEFINDDTDLPDSSVKFSQLLSYYQGHVDTNANGTPVYEGYLCGIEALTDDNGNVLDIYWGATYYLPGPYSHSFICMHIVPAGCDNKTIIHELGHQRAGLPHLCWDDSNTVMNPFHTGNDCVMGKDRFSTCTGANLCSNPHFCIGCRESLKSVSW